MKMSLSVFLQLKGNVFLYKRLNRFLCYYFILFLGKIYYLINRSEKNLIIESIEYAFMGRKSRAEIKVITKNVFRGILAHYYEKVHNAYNDINELDEFFQKYIEAPGLNKLDDALKKGKGVMLVTAHYGAVEYIPIFLALNGYPVSVVVKFKTTQLEAASREQVKGFGMNIINAANEQSITTHIMRELRGNRVVFMECDEIDEWRPSKTNKIWFVNKLIGVDRTLDILQRRTGAEVVFAIVHRFDMLKYKFILENCQDMLKRFGSSFSSIGAVVLKSFEEYIYSSPEGWYQWKNFAKLERSDIYKEVYKRKSGFPSLQPT